MYLPSDIIFEKDYSLLGKMIRIFTQSKNESKTIVNHIFGYSTPPTVINTSWVVNKQNFNPENTTKKIIIFRMKNLSDIQRNLISESAERFLNSKYSILRLITLFLDNLLEKIFGGHILFFRKLTKTDINIICSYIWAKAYYNALNNYTFGMLPEYITPDDMYDFISTSSDWEIIYKNF